MFTVYLAHMNAPSVPLTPMKLYDCTFRSMNTSCDVFYDISRRETVGKLLLHMPPLVQDKWLTLKQLVEIMRMLGARSVTTSDIMSTLQHYHPTIIHRNRWKQVRYYLIGDSKRTSPKTNTIDVIPTIK